MARAPGGRARPTAVCLAMRVATEVMPVRFARITLVADFATVATLLAAWPASSPYLLESPTRYK